MTGHALRRLRLRRRRTVVVYAAASTRARYRRPPSRQDSTLRLILAALLAIGRGPTRSRRSFRPCEEESPDG